MKKSTVIAIIVFIGVLFVIVTSYVIYNNLSKEKYYCTDYETNTTYIFNTEDEMHEVCDKFSGVEKDKTMKSYKIYDDLINNKDNRFTFYPYVSADNKLNIIITIIDCNNKELAKEKAVEWFKNHSYDINDYTIEFEYPCE